jgi:hypothetical protein
MPSDEIRDGQRYYQGMPEWQWQKLESERYKRENPEKSPDGEGIIALALIFGVIYVLSFIFEGIGMILTYIEYLIMNHWVIFGFIFLYLLRVSIVKKYNKYLKLLLILYCFYGLFNVASGYMMQGAMERWQGQYKLVYKRPEFSLAEKKNKRGKKKKEKKVKIELPIPIENSKYLQINSNNEVLFSDINKVYSVKSYDYPKFFHRLVNKRKGYSENVTTEWKDLGTDKIYSDFKMSMKKDTLELKWGNQDYWYFGVYAKIRNEQ